MSDTYTPTTSDRDKLRGALVNVLSNASSFPEKVQSRILGQDMTLLIDRTAEAILASDWLSTVVQQAYAEGILRSEATDD